MNPHEEPLFSSEENSKKSEKETSVSSGSSLLG